MTIVNSFLIYRNKIGITSTKVLEYQKYPETPKANKRREQNTQQDPREKERKPTSTQPNPPPMVGEQPTLAQ